MKIWWVWWNETSPCKIMSVSFCDSWICSIPEINISLEWKKKPIQSASSYFTSYLRRLSLCVINLKTALYQSKFYAILFSFFFILLQYGTVEQLICSSGAQPRNCKTQNTHFEILSSWKCLILQNMSSGHWLSADPRVLSPNAVVLKIIIFFLKYNFF